MKKCNEVILSTEEFNLLINGIIDLKNEILELKKEIKPIITFFNNSREVPVESKIKLTKKEQFNIELKRRKLELEKQSIERIKNASKTKSEKIAILSSKILRRGKTKFDRS